MKIQNKRAIVSALAVMLGLFVLTACVKDKETRGDVNPSDTYVTTQKDLDIKFREINDGFVYENQIYVAGIDDNGNSLLGISSLEGKTVKELVFDTTGTIALIQPDRKGNIVYISSIYNEESGAGDLILGKIDSSGSKLLEVNISDDLKQSQGSYVYLMASDQDCNLYLATNSNGVLLYNEAGEYQGVINCGSVINSMSGADGGQVYIAYSAGQGLVVSPLDFANKSVGKSIPLTIGTSASHSGETEVNNQFLVSDAASLYELDIIGKEGTKVLDWIDCGIDGNSINSVSALENGNYFIILSDFHSTGDGNKMLVVEKRKDVEEKITLTYGTVYLDPTTQNKIIEFNKNSDKYIISVTNYDYENDPNAIEKMTVDIMTGNAPDIIDMKMNDAEKIIARELLEDLYPYMEKDQDINQEDYLENVLQVYERNDKLYAIMPFFLIKSMTGKTKNVGEVMGWTLEDMNQLMAQHPNAKLYENATADSILQLGVNAYPSRFFDWETGECNFEGEEFIQLLEFASQFGMETEELNSIERIDKLRAEEYLLKVAFIYNINVYRDEKNRFGEDVTFIGYPAREGVGSRIETAVCSLAISANSKNKEGAWEFMKQFLNPEYQRQDFGLYTLGFPIRKDALDLLIDKEMTPNTYVGGDGKEIEMPKRTWDEYKQEADEPPIEVYAASKEEMEAFKKFIQTADGLYDYNVPILNIVREEAAAYFEGQKTAEEVAKIIQSRMNIYLNENR